MGNITIIISGWHERANFINTEELLKGSLLAGYLKICKHDIEVNLGPD